MKPQYKNNTRSIITLIMMALTSQIVAQPHFEVFTIETTDGAKLSAEDPYVWYDESDRMFYAVFKDFTGHFTKAGPSLAWMQSRDGIEWTLPEKPLFIKKEVVLK